MKVLELLDEIEDIIETSSGFPLTGKVLVDAEEILEIIREIRIELPDEIQQAQWIKDERQRILDEAKHEYEAVLKEARVQAEALIENDDITVKAKARAEEIMGLAEKNVKNLKMSTFDYIDSILYNFQDKMEQMYATYFTDMFNDIQILVF
jgi:vacuolar-type H+-ATPase subunit H